MLWSILHNIKIRCNKLVWRYLQLGQGYPWDLQNQACQVILEDQQDPSFLGDLPSQALPFTQKQEAHKPFDSCSFAGSLRWLVYYVLRQQKIWTCWMRYLGSLLSLSSLRSSSSRGSLFKNEETKRQRLVLRNTKKEHLSILTLIAFCGDKDKRAQDSTYSLSWWSRGTRLSSGSRRTLVWISMIWKLYSIPFCDFNGNFY